MNDALRELFTTDVGLFSLAVIVGCIVIGAYLNSWVRARIREDELRSKR